MKPRYMIHTVPERETYVRGLLIPRLMEQGIPKSRIKVWLDDRHAGNLVSTMTSFLWCGEKNKGKTWHLQDDVLPSVAFADQAEWYADLYPVVCGFVPDKTYDGETGEPGSIVRPIDMPYSFPCILIDDALAQECARWFLYHDGGFGLVVNALVREGKGDDTLFRRFLTEEHPDTEVRILSPCLVQHVDDLLGGSVINPDRDFPIRARVWEDQGEMEQLNEWLGRERKE